MVLISALLLLVVFRSVLVAVKAIAMNLLSVAAAFGVVVAVFQWGWLGGLIGISTTAPIAAFLPVMVFADRLRPVDGLRGVPDVAHP